MEMAKSRNVLGIWLMIGALGLSTSALAAETSTGTNEHFELTIKSTQAAQAAAAANNKEGCLTNLKQARQHYKQITGAASGMPLQKAMAKMREGQAACESGDTAKGAAILSEVVTDLQKISGTPR